MSNILYISVTSAIGGGPKHLYTLLKLGEKSGNKFFVIAPNNGEYFEKFKKYATVYDMDLRHHFISNLKIINCIIKRNHISLIHSHGKGGGLYSRILKLFNPKVKVVHTFHGIHYLQYNKLIAGIYFYIERILCSVSDYNICVSQKEYEEAEKLGFGKKKNLKLIYNGINIDNYDISINRKEYIESLGIQDDSYIVGMISRMDNFKGHKEMISAFNNFQVKYSNAVLLLVGDGPLRGEIVEYIHSLKLESKVIMLGTRMDVPKLLQIMDMVISASHKEGLPYTLLEALAAKRPIVATEVTGNTEIILDGYNGYLAQAKDSESLYRAMIKMKENVKKQEEFIKNGYSRVKEVFDEKQMFTSIEAVYEQILKEKFR